MNFRNIKIIISREYLNKVKKKSFLVITFLVPVLFAVLLVLPSLIMLGAKEESKKIAVIDASGIVLPTLENTESVEYIDLSAYSLDSVKTALKSFGVDAVLSISEINTAEKTVSADIYSEKPIGLDLSGNLNGRIEKAVESYRIESYGIEGLEDIMKDIKANIKLHSYTVDEKGKENVSESVVYMIVSMILGMIIYMFIALFGGMVMSSVIEEKSSRVVEVLVSSVKATELLFGKIIGIALVALTQFFLWILLTLTIVGVIGAAAGLNHLGGSDPTELVQTMGVGGESVEMIEEIANGSNVMSVISGTLSNMNFGLIIACFVIYFLFGYMLYASIYAAIGSSGESNEDTQQLQIPVTIPLLIAFFIVMYANKAPDSALVFWASMIPFTSPIVMLARIPFDVPMWQIITSIVLLVGTFILFAWASAKVYKVGILMFGKKATWKDLWKWFKLK